MNASVENNKKDSNSDFTQLMYNMKEYYKGNTETETFILPEGYQKLFRSLATSASLSMSPELAAATKQYQDDLTSFTSNQQNNATQNTQEVVNDPSKINDFRQQMEQQRQAAKAAANQNIDKYYDNLTNIGVNHPEQQEMIVAVAQQVLQFANNLFSKLTDFINNLIRNISEWFEAAFTHIKNFFSGTLGSIEGFFSKL